MPFSRSQKVTHTTSTVWDTLLNVTRVLVITVLEQDKIYFGGMRMELQFFFLSFLFFSLQVTSTFIKKRME